MKGRMSVLLMVALVTVVAGRAHEHTLHRFLQSLQSASSASSRQTESPAQATGEACRLQLNLEDSADGGLLPGMVRVTNLDSGKFILLPEGIEREEHWYAIPEASTLSVPRTRVLVEAFHGLETEKSTLELDLTGKQHERAGVKLERFYDSRRLNLRSGNTHLHLRNLSRAQAEEYLTTVSRADDLDLLFVSYLRRIPGEESYISNSFTAADLQRLSRQAAFFGNGEEHRHNFGTGGEGYGHVMFLNIRKLIEPVSIGPGIMQSGTDGIPLQRGIRAAHSQGATVIWCHNSFGLEDIPNWASELIDAQNIFDGGSQGSYEDTFYRYLNIGKRVPFSTGTDWFVYDFSRVYVPILGEVSVIRWLDALARGRSYITNGPLLEFEVENKMSGDTLELNQPRSLRVRAGASGRRDFGGLELIWNGKVVYKVPSTVSGGHFQAALRHTISARMPGWLAVRIPWEAGNNEFGKPLFAHTSPVYIHFRGESVFFPKAAQGLIDEMKRSQATIEEEAHFAGSGERERVLSVYCEGIRMLERQLRSRSKRD